MEKIRVLVIERQTVYREGVRAILSHESDIEVIDGAERDEEILAQIQMISPDVVIFAPESSTSAGFTLLRQIKQYSRALPVVVLAEPQNQEALLLSIKTGAAAYLTKSAASEEIIKAVRETHQGEYLINEKLFSNPRIASQVLSLFQDMTMPGEEAGPFLAPLSPREIDVLNLIAKGKSNKDIAREFSILSLIHI